MRLKESIFVAVSPRVLWPLVADPVLMSRWNAKIVAVERAGDGPVRTGETFRMLVRMSGQDREGQVEVIDCHTFESIALRHRQRWRGRDQVADWRCELFPQGEGVRVVQTVDLVGLPWPIQVLFWFITRFGWKEGPDSLQRLKELAESGSNSPRSPANAT